MPQITVKTAAGDEYAGEFVRFSTPPGTDEQQIGVRLSDTHTVYIPLPVVDEINVEGTLKHPIPRELEEHFRLEQDENPLTLFDNEWEISTTHSGPARFDDPSDAMNAIADVLEGDNADNRWKASRKIRLDEAENMMLIAQRQGFVKTNKLRVAAI